MSRRLFRPNLLSTSLVSWFTAVLLMGAGSAGAEPPCNNGPIFAFSQAVYVSDFTRAQALIPEIRQQRNDRMADFLQQVLIYTRGYELDLQEERAAALQKIDVLIEGLTDQLNTRSSLQSRLDAGNIMMNAARLHLLSRNIMRSAQLAKAAYQLLDEVLKEDPLQADAFLSMGLYQYFAANDNNAWGWVKRLLSLQGDKEVGREMIERAVETSGDYAFEAARSLMMDLAWDHPNICRYVDLFDQLEVPELATLEHRQRSIAARLFCGRAEQGSIELQQAKLLLEQGTLFASEAQTQWLFEAELHAMAMQGQSGVLRELLTKESNQNSQTAMTIRFSLARALDVKGERSRAREYYAQVAGSDVDDRYQRLAVRYRQQAYRASKPVKLQQQTRIQFVCKD